MAVFMKRLKAVSVSLFLTNSVLTCLLRGSRLDTHTSLAVHLVGCFSTCIFFLFNLPVLSSSLPSRFLFQTSK